MKELRDFYTDAITREIARDLKRAQPAFPDRRFVADALRGLAPLSLTGRAAHVAAAMRTHLPQDFAEAAGIIKRSLGSRHAGSDTFGMGPFKYLPHTMYVAAHGLAHFEESMQLQFELTQRFSAEFSIRPFLIHHPEATYERLRVWARHKNVHVRRLVSEGSRPRLPWAQRLRHFQKDPAPVVTLLEMLKDDPELYVRRSVANNLNDIAKDHPKVAVDTCRRWMKGASSERAWIVRHALRSLVKQGHAGALDLLGVGRAPKILVGQVSIRPARVRLGGRVECTCEVTSTSKSAQDLLIDYQVHYVKANGGTSAKVFKGKRVVLEPARAVPFKVTVKLADLTTRKHYPGRHAIDLLVNGKPFPLGSFVVLR